MIGVLPGARALLLLAAVSLAQAQNTTTVKPATPLLLNDAERIVVFGDSYSANVYQGYQFTDDLSGIGPGAFDTTTGGSNWIQFAAQQAGLSDSLYEFAIPGSTIRKTPSASYNGLPIPSFVDAVDVFNKSFTGVTGAMQWQPESTLFIVTYGINDVVGAITRGTDFDLVDVSNVYKAQVERLYKLGARQFVLMSVAPYDRTPIAQGAQELYEEYIGDFNEHFPQLVKEIGELTPEAEIRVWDWHASITKVLDDAQAGGYMDLVHVCPPYAMMRGYDPEFDVAICGKPLARFVWKDLAHPSWPVHQLLGSSAYNFLNSGNPSANIIWKRRAGEHRMDPQIKRLLKVNAGPESPVGRNTSSSFGTIGGPRVQRTKSRNVRARPDRVPRPRRHAGAAKRLSQRATRLQKIGKI